MLTGALELFLVSMGLTYFLATTGAGLRVLRAQRRAQAASGTWRHRRPRDPATPDLLKPAARWSRRMRVRLATPEEPSARGSVVVDPADCVVYYLVPCLNEEPVIEETVRGLLSDPRGRVIVIDDASEDRTGELAAAISPDRVSVVRRELPEARQGKGMALNAGFAYALHDAAERGIAAARITICVMDADGRLSPGALDAVLPLFSDPRIGGVQLPVRIRNRGSLLTIMQDVEFWGVCAIAQLGRIASGTVSLGGNGQFTRLRALLDLRRSPWGSELTEDLDLTLALANEGWRLISTPGAYVSQQGVTSVKALIRQRARWYQGHMQAVRWLPKLWTSRKLSHIGMLELTLYLAVPWMLVLPWSVVFNYNLILMLGWIAGWNGLPVLGADLVQRVSTVLFWYSVSCLPIWLAGIFYYRQQDEKGLAKSFLLGHLLLFGNYVTYAACWRALYRLVTGANGWQKTARLEELTPRARVIQAGVVPAPRAAAGAVTAGSHRAGAPVPAVPALTAGAHRAGQDRAAVPALTAGSRQADPALTLAMAIPAQASLTEPAPPELVPAAATLVPPARAGGKHHRRSAATGQPAPPPPRPRRGAHRQAPPQPAERGAHQSSRVSAKA
ncbi:MAG: glycosyltransferase [Actinomycetota bacterium]